MAADIEMGVDGVAVSAHHDDLFSCNSEEEEVPLLGDATDVVGVLPLPGKQVRELFFEDLRREVERLLDEANGVVRSVIGDPPPVTE